MPQVRNDLVESLVGIDINDFEVALLNRNLKDVFDAFDYPAKHSTSRMKQYFRQPNEKLSTYIQNRLFLRDKMERRSQRL